MKTEKILNKVICPWGTYDVYLLKELPLKTLEDSNFRPCMQIHPVSS